MIGNHGLMLQLFNPDGRAAILVDNAVLPAGCIFPELREDIRIHRHVLTGFQAIALGGEKFPFQRSADIGCLAAKISVER